MSKVTLINEFRDLATGYIQSLPVSAKSRKNYLSDTAHFVRWLEKFLLEEKVDFNSLSEIAEMLGDFGFDEHLGELKQSSTPQVTINRRMTTMRHISKGLGMYGYDSSDRPGLSERVGRKSADWAGYYKYAVFVAILLLGVPLSATLGGSSRTKIADPELAWAGNNIILQGDARRDVAFSGPYEIVLADSNSYDIQLDHVGHSILRAGNKQAIVMTDVANTDSFILVSPTSSTGGLQIYVSDQGEGYFVVSVDKQVVNDISFNWLVK